MLSCSRGWLVYQGYELLKLYKQDVEKYEAQRQELANAEILFDLPVTVYQELLQVQKELKGQEHIYTIYEEQKVRPHSCDFHVVFNCATFSDLNNYRIIVPFH